MSLLMSMVQMIEAQGKAIELKRQAIKSYESRYQQGQRELAQMIMELNISQASVEYAKKYLEGETE